MTEHMTQDEIDRMFDPAVCDNCGRDEHTPAQLAACIASMVPRPENGVDRCPCGCKYWNGNRCMDCGDYYDWRDSA